jgi:hypothetical protein
VRTEREEIASLTLIQDAEAEDPGQDDEIEHRTESELTARGNGQRAAVIAIASEPMPEGELAAIASSGHEIRNAQAENAEASEQEEVREEVAAAWVATAARGAIADEMATQAAEVAIETSQLATETAEATSGQTTTTDLEAANSQGSNGQWVLDDDHSTPGVAGQ